MPTLRRILSRMTGLPAAGGLRAPTLGRRREGRRREGRRPHAFASLRQLPLRAAFLAFGFASPAAAEDVTVFAAASLQTALSEVAELWATETGGRAVIVPAGSSALARQILAGAPADLFISASPEWMDAVAADGRVVPETRTVIAGNRLALIASGAGAPGRGEIGPGDDLAALLGEGRLAMALVEAVPAGAYGKAALETLGQWEALAPQVAQTDNVRAALALVAAGAAPLGVVYASDAVAEPRVRVLALFPEASHPPITYPAAVVAGGDEAAGRAFLSLLTGAAGQAALERQGFLPPPEG